MQAAPAPERVSLRVVAHDFAYVSVRLPGVSLSGIQAKRDGMGRVRLVFPVTTGRDGQEYPLMALQPGTLEAVTRAVTTAWAEASRPSQGVH